MTAPSSSPSRWRLRFENFCRAEKLLAEAVAERRQRPLSELEEAGLIQRFELLWELGWKVLRDYMTESGAPPDVPSPVNVIRGAFAMNLINDGDGWIAAMKLRNQTSHECDKDAASAAADEIADRHLALFSALAEKLTHEGQSSSRIV